MAEGARGLVFKVAVVGESRVGKTSLVKQYVFKQFGDRYLKTLGTNVYQKTLIGIGPQKRNVSLQLWDVLGQRVFHSIIKTVFKGVHGVIFVCDVTNRRSLEDLEHWTYYAYKHTTDPPAYVFLGNKCDIPERELQEQDLSRLADIYKASWFFTSAKTGLNVEKAFRGLAENIVQGKKAPSRLEAEIRKDEQKVTPLVSAEDEVINTFCEAVGGLEPGMPLVREVFQHLGVDFEDPRPEQLVLATQMLVEHARKLYGANAAGKLEAELEGILKTYEVI